MQPMYQKPEEKKPEPPTQVLGTGMAAKAAGFLRGRKAQIDAASNYKDGGMVMEKPKTAPKPQMLGKGFAAGAAKMLMDRRSQIDGAVDKATGYKDGGMVKDYAMGGMVRGPGTGTSDDVPAMVRPGSYVMPADTTRKLVNLSNGEMVIPPEQTQQIGVGLMDAVRAATHKGGMKKSDGKNFAVGGQIPGASDEERMAAQRALAERGRITGNDFTRNATNTLTALAPVAGVGNVGAGLVSAAGRLGSAGTASPALGKVAAYGAPIGGFGAISNASQEPAPAVPRPAAPPSVTPNPAASPVAQMDPTSPARQDPANPAQTRMATPAGNEVRPGIFRQGNSFSDTAEGAADFARPNVISPQNMAAADALAQRGAQQRMSLVQAAQQQGGGNITPRTSGSGFGLLDQGARDRRAAMMDSQQMKPGARTALAALLRQQGEAPGLELRREGMDMDQENRQADLGFRREELGARMGDAAATRDLRSQELADTMATNAVRRDAAGVELGAARRMQELQQEYLSARTPEAQAEAARKIQALSGRQEQANRFTVVPQGSMVDPTSGQVVQQPAMVINNQTGQPVQIGGQQGSPALPPGMTRQVGTSGGKPVYEDAQGRRFVAP